MSTYRAEDVTSVVEEMAQAIDERLWDRVAGAFASRVVLDYGVPELVTPDEIVARWRPMMSAFDRMRHTVDGSTVRFEPVDRARVDARFRADHHLDGAMWQLSGNYECELVMHGAQWKLTRLRMIYQDSSGDPTLLEKVRIKAGVPAPVTPSYRIERLTFSVGGERVVGLLHLPASAPLDARLPAAAVLGPITSVKEQVVAHYARRLATAGFAALTIDFRHHGESEGLPRHLESPSRKLEDIRAAIDLLASHHNVDPDRIALVGVCAGAGYVAATAASDARVKKLALVAPWLHDASLARDVYRDREVPGCPGIGVAALIEAGREARQRFDADGTAELVPTASAVDRHAAVYRDDRAFLDYYLSEQRGGIPQWGNRFAVMSWPEWLDFDAIASAPALRQPTLIVDAEAGLLPEGRRRFAAAMQQAPRVVLTDDGPFDFFDGATTIDRATAEVVAHLA
ncbi:MAG: alpha/beta fold hydrolase [Kofleriaceae bacterium]|nr:alpha/beta fold hydrolase [Kofleriaceae bacterium]